MSTSVFETAPRETITGRLSGVVYDRIVDMIATGAFPLNSRMPTEMDLSERFQASRPVVREALQRLREDGLIVSRQGSGSYVKRRPEADVLQLAPVGSLADIQRCFEFRAGLEPAGAALAAERRDSEDLERIAAAMRELERCLAEGHLGAEQDSDLHDEIARATHNQYHVSVQASLRSHVIAGMNVTRSLSLRRSAPQLRSVQTEHENIVDAIHKKDPDAAYSAMRTHVLNARKRMFEGT